MCATFTDDDLDKRVENENGDVIGTITEIQGETARIEPRSGVVRSIKAALGWRQSDDETVSIHENAIDEITNDAVRLEGRADSAAEPADGPPIGFEGESPAQREDEPPENLEEEAPETLSDAAAAGSEADREIDPPDERDERVPGGDPPGGHVDERDRGIATDEPNRAVDTDPSAAPSADSSTDPEPVTDREREPANAAERDPGTEPWTTGEPREETQATHEETDPAETNTTASDAETRDLSDELDLGPDVESLEDAGGTEARDASTETTETPAAELNRGVDIESAVDEPRPDVSSDERETESMDLSDELATGIDIDSVGGTAEPDAADTRSERDRDIDLEDREPAAQLDPGVDAVSTESDRKSESAIEGKGKPEPGTDRAHRGDRSSDRPDGASPAAAAVAAQRVALAGSRDAMRLGLASQRNAARAALEWPLALQRGGLELTAAATEQYFSAVAAMAGLTFGTERESGSDAFEGAAADAETIRTQLDDEAIHSRVDDEAFVRDLAEYFERQAELLERSLDAESESEDGTDH
ncbi:PRC-barrel domain-containing protein [Halopiger djelfimassiliensis]|uniref:PRC-barrel domain-containing protein n=1 Tax=Halopiger djelfimassiliensis TaxID=1293047 RepID=UPI000678029D|nr:PRC-barrel domain-containing protein [Halopiger djelfimassiliensis]